MKLWLALHDHDSGYNIYHYFLPAGEILTGKRVAADHGLDWEALSEVDDPQEWLSIEGAHDVPALDEALAACRELIKGDGTPASEQRAIDLARKALFVLGEISAA